MSTPKLSPLIKTLFGDRDLSTIEQSLRKLAIDNTDLYNKEFTLSNEDGLLKYSKALFFINKFNVVFVVDLID